MDDGIHHGGHHEAVGNAFALDEIQGFLSVEVIHHHVAATGEPNRQVLIARAVGDGAQVQALVAGLHRGKRIKPVPAGGEPGFVGIGHPLGKARRAAGMANDEVVVRRDGQTGVLICLGFEPTLVARVPDDDVLEIGQLVCEPGHLTRMIFADDQRAAVGVAKHVPMRVAAVARVKGHAHEVCDRRAAEEVGRLHRVVFEHPDSISRMEPQAAKTIAEPHTPLPGLAESEPAVTMDDSLAVGVVCGRPGH